MFGQVLNENPQVVFGRRSLRRSLSVCCQLFDDRHKYGVEPGLISRDLCDEELSEAAVVGHGGFAWSSFARFYNLHGLLRSLILREANKMLLLRAGNECTLRFRHLRVAGRLISDLDLFLTVLQLRSVKHSIQLIIIVDLTQHLLFFFVFFLLWHGPIFCDVI